MNRTEIFGFPIDIITLEEALTWVEKTVASPELRGRILTFNATGLMVAEEDEFLDRYAREAELVVADGQPLVWTAPLFGPRLPERVAGIDLFDRMCALATERGWGVFLLGAESETIAEASRILTERHPGLTVAGVHHGFLTDDATKAAAVSAIAESGAALLFAGMGMPRQEQFIDAHWDDLGVDVAMGVGGSFEVLTGRLQRAPDLVQRLGLEWAYRTLQEPRRLAGRYAATLWWLTRRTAPALARRLIRRR